MALLEPKLSILDETDSGLDIDALRICANGVNKLKTAENATIVITHYQRLLDYMDNARNQPYPVFWTEQDAADQRVRAMCHMVLCLPEFQLVQLGTA